MTAAIGDDGIDPSHFLPRNASIINRFRHDKGDLVADVVTRSIEGKPVNVVTHAKVRDVTICAELIRKGILEDHHRVYGVAFLELQHASRAPLQHRLNASCLEDLVGSSVSGSRAVQMYEEIIKPLTLRRARIIDHACNSPAGSDAACQHTAGQNAYRECFDMLVRLLDDARAKLKAEKEKALAEDDRFR